MKPVLMGSIGLVFFPTWMVDSYSELVGKQSKRPIDLSWGYELGLFAILLDDDSLRLPGTCFDVKRTVEVKSIKTLTLLGTNISPTSRHFWVDDFPFPKVGYVSSLEGKAIPELMFTDWYHLMHLHSLKLT